MNRTAIIYHEIKSGVPCPDGLAAAWVANKVFPQSDVIGVNYGNREQLDVSDYKELIIVDFSFPVSTIKEWRKQNKKILLIDHHKTALNDLSTLITNGVLNSDRRIIFDMDECGATLTWKTLLQNRPMPPFLRYIKDRDIWLHRLPCTHEIHAALSALKPSFKLFDVLELMTEEALIKYLKPLGLKELKKRHERILELAAHHYWDIIGGYEVPIVNLSKEDAYLTSDICAYLYKRFPKAPFAAVVTSTKVSLRSDKDGLNTDVGAIAKMFGGGGHNCASSYQLNKNA